VGETATPTSPNLPTGALTFLFTDIEGSTRLLHELGADRYGDLLEEHRRLVRASFAAHAGVEVDTQGDAFFYAFGAAQEACVAAADAQHALKSVGVSIRIGIHSGTAHRSEAGYVGADVHKGARIAAAGHGGQVLISRQTREQVTLDVLDLGEHRLKDFDEAIWIFQLGVERFPPLRTISNTNLPRPASSFVGRTHEVEAVVSALRDGARLVTVTGPGGTGKTRLAIEAAARLVDDNRNGVFWVNLAPVRDASLVGAEIARSVGAKGDLADYMADREALLVLDNFEHVIDAARDVSALLTRSANLRVLVTSRERLRIQGEVERKLAPLAEAEAVELFCARAGLAADEVIASLCRRLDNLPLAVELAAARTGALSPRQILERLAARPDMLKAGRDADPRQQTLRATVSWSYELLDPTEQSAFVNLSVFRGGWTLEAAEIVAGADLAEIESLVDKSLISLRGERYATLETIREFAAEQLAATGAVDGVRRRHLDYLVGLTERAYDEQYVAEHRWLEALEPELDNIRAALDFAEEPEPDKFARLAGSVAPYWMLGGHPRELRERLNVAIGVAPDEWQRARALMFRATLDDSVEELDQVIAAFQRLGDLRQEGMAWESLGWAHDTHGDYVAAGRAQEKSLAVRSGAGVPDVEGLLSRAGLCHVLVATGDVVTAEAAAGELLAVAGESDAALSRQLALHFLADCPLVAGDYAEAAKRYLRALLFARDNGLIGRSTDEVLGVAMALAGQGESHRALRLAAASHAEQRAIGKTSDAWWHGMQDRLLGRARAGLGASEADEAERQGSALAFAAVMDEVLGAGSRPQ
jgi:predicted ATPase/class 3 adenylate cyclase